MNWTERLMAAFMHRLSRLNLVPSIQSLGWGIVSKFMGLLNQIVSVKLVAQTLGEPGLGEQLVAISAVSWFNIALVGINTSLPSLLMSYEAGSEGFSKIVRVAFFLSLLSGFFCFVALIFILHSNWINGSDPIIAAAACNAIVTFSCISERIFYAEDRISVFYKLNIAGSLLSLAFTIFLSFNYGTATHFIISHYCSILVPFLIGTLLVLVNFDSRNRIHYPEFFAVSRSLLKTGFFSLGYDIAAFCKMQAPLTILAAIGLTSSISSIGLSLRYVAIIGGGLSIMLPILFVRIGRSAAAGEEISRVFWTGFGVLLALFIALSVSLFSYNFCDTIFRAWSGGIVTLSRMESFGLAFFCGTLYAEVILVVLITADHNLSDKIRYLFWIEGPALLLTTVCCGLFSPKVYAGAVTLTGLGAVILVTNLFTLAYLCHRVIVPSAAVIWAGRSNILSG